jgi:hypothetical protein
MSDADTPSPTDTRGRFQRTLIQVLIVQVVALGLLGLIQILYS